MKRGSHLIAAVAALLLSFAAAPAGAAEHAGEIVHVVAKGQTLGRIAKRYHVTIAALRAANDLAPGQRIHPGLSLVIPEKGKEAEAARRAAHLKEKAGDRAGKKERQRPEKGGARGTKGAQKAKKDDSRGKADAGSATFSKRRKRRGFVRMARGSDKLEAQILGRRGHLAPRALAGLSRILRFYPTGEKTAIDPRLAALIGAVSDHFGGRPIRVVSGYRPYTPAQYTPHSNHNLGRAMDFSIDGVPNTALRDFCRTFRNAGVGYYPNSSFVHLDARAGKAYWVDYSHPGEAPHYNSPAAQRSADEAVGDVEPHVGAGAPVDGGGSAPKPPPEGGAGSSETQ